MEKGKAQQAVNIVKPRFWLMDEIIKIGHLEASMSHSDEQICNLDHDIEINGDDLKKVEALADEKTYHRELIHLNYDNRTACENDIMEWFNGDKKDWCYIKHQAAVFVIACENYHARGCDPHAEASVIASGKALALATSHCFGLGMMDCLRCVGESMQAGYGQSDASEKVLRIGVMEVTEDVASDKTEKPTKK